MPELPRYDAGPAGGRRALLVHGLSSDARGWWQVSADARQRWAESPAPVETVTSHRLAELDMIQAHVAGAHVDSALHALRRQFGLANKPSTPE